MVVRKLLKHLLVHKYPIFVCYHLVFLVMHSKQFASTEHNAHSLLLRHCKWQTFSRKKKYDVSKINEIVLVEKSNSHVKGISENEKKVYTWLRFET